MKSPHLPVVLLPPPPYSALSMERSLKQIRELLLEALPADDTQPELTDKVLASIDDVDVMLECIKRD